MIILPIPPSTNHLFFNLKGRGGRAPTNEYKAWTIRAGLHLNKQAVKPVEGNVAVVIRVPQDVRGDLDNRIKAPLDLLVKHKIITDDRFVQSIHISRFPGEHMEIELAAA